jgi:hypothetical protein
MRRFTKWMLASGVVVLAARGASAVTRDIADLAPVRLTFGQSVIHQLSFGTYRDPFDELQTRPCNLLFTNIGRHPNLSPWQGQEGSYTKYLNALIGNNGVANVDNDADALQGSWIQRQTDTFSWGVSAAFLSGTSDSAAATGTTTFEDADELRGADLRGAAAFQLSERSVLGTGIHFTQATSEISEDSFEPGVGGFHGQEKFDQTGVAVDAGLRWFSSPAKSWDVQGVAGFGTATQEDFSEDIDDTGATTDRFVIRNYELSDMSLGISGGYNWLPHEGLGETEFRGGLLYTQRDLDNTDLSFSETGGTVTPEQTLLDSTPVSITQLVLSGRRLFAAGETELALGGQVGYALTDGSTTVDAAGTIVTEEVDDSQIGIGISVGLRQSLYKDKLRFLVSARADILDSSIGTTFTTSSSQVDSTRTVLQYAIGIEGVLANVTFDVAWLNGEEAPVVPVDLGIPSGSRRTVTLDRLVFSAAVSW